MKWFYSVLMNDWNWIRQHKNVCIIFICSWLTATVAAICIHFSDSFYVEGISHLRRYIALLGMPDGMDFQPHMVVVGVIGILLIGISVTLFAICINIFRHPQEEPLRMGKVTLKKYLPFVDSFMLCFSLHLCIPLYSGNVVWMNILNRDAMYYTEMISEIAPPYLLCLCSMWGFVFIAGDILGDEYKWISVLALLVVSTTGMIALCILIYQNICQLWYLIPNIGAVAVFTIVSGVWAVFD